MVLTLSILVLGLTCTSLIVAHPGEHHDRVKVARDMNERGFDAEEQMGLYRQCSDSDERRAMKSRAHARRGERLRKLREERGITSDGKCQCIEANYG